MIKIIRHIALFVIAAFCAGAEAQGSTPVLIPVSNSPQATLTANSIGMLAGTTANLPFYLTDNDYYKYLNGEDYTYVYASDVYGSFEIQTNNAGLSGTVTSITKDGDVYTLNVAVTAIEGLFSTVYDVAMTWVDASDAPLTDITITRHVQVQIGP